MSTNKDDKQNKGREYFQVKGEGVSREAEKFVDSQVRRRVAKDWRLRGMVPRERARHRRAIEAIVRKDKTYDARRASLRKEDLILLLRPIRPSKVLDCVYPERNRPGTWLRFENRTAGNDDAPIQMDLKNFSFIDDPVSTLEGFRRLGEYEAFAHSVRLNFKDEYCLDVVPYMLLTEFWSDMLPIFRGGEMLLPVQKVLAAIGIEEDLKVGFAGISDFDDVWAFPLTRRRRPGDSRSRSIYFDVPTRDYASDRFCDAMNEWLMRPEIDLELTDSGRGKIKVLLDELLENAERHSDGLRRDGSWTVAGFLAKRKAADDDVFIAHIGIVSLGDTFSESLDRASDVQKGKIGGYLKNMARMGAHQSAPTLKTLAAIQDGVTCVPEADQHERGGTGLMEMLELTNLLGFSDKEEMLPQITIISGRSCVQLKPPYFDCQSVSGEDGERVQWCNSNNSAKTPPDKGHVFDLNVGLPGTAISIRFTLDPQYLQEIVGR